MAGPIYSGEEIDGRGRAGNLYHLLAVAQARLHRYGVSHMEREQFKHRVLTAPTFELSIKIIREYFPVKLED